MPEHRLLILGTGSIAQRHAEQFSAIPGCRIVAAVDINAERVSAYAATHNIRDSFTDLEAALSWGEFDAAVNATPDAIHLPTTLQLLAAGKHVFCEKPLAVNHGDAMIMTRAAEQAGVVNMVNLSYRNAHALQAARRMVMAGEIGVIRHIEASYLQSWLTANHWGDWRTGERWLWRLSAGHGSKGVLGDIGIHIVDFVTFGANLDIAALGARLQTFDKAPGNAIGAYRLDVNDSVAMTVEFSNGALGVIHMSRFATGYRNDLNLTLHGEKGALRVWSETNTSRLDACLGDDIHTQTWKQVECPPTLTNTERFIAALQNRSNADPDFRRAAEVQKILDLCFVSDAERRMLATD